MKALIKTFAPTPYQYNSAKSFRLEHSKTIFGQLVCWQHFNTVDDARHYLNQIARELYSDEPIRNMFDNLSKWGLSYDEAHATILVGDEIESFLIQIQ